MPFTRSEETRVSRLENDVEAVYEVLGEIQQTQAAHSGQLTGIQQTQAAHARQIQKLDTKIDGVEERLDTKIDGVEERLSETLAEVLRRLPQ